MVGVGDGVAVLASEVGVLFRLGVPAELGELLPYGVAVGLIVAELTLVELLDPADRLAPPEGGSPAAAGEPAEPITTANTTIKTITTAARIKARRIQ